MHAFIVRAFGRKSGVDFEQVDRVLISPALDSLQITGRTTQELVRAGNIRADMFHLLLTADLVIADISIHKNVFYELGVRHALREKATILLRASIDDVPFDLKTDRHLSYDAAKPEECLERLIKAISETVRSRSVDSVRGATARAAICGFSHRSCPAFPGAARDCVWSARPNFGRAT